MRICHVDFLGYPGRAGAVPYELSQLEARQGLDVTAIVVDEEAKTLREQDVNGVHVVYFPAPSTSARSPAKLRFILSARDYIARHKFDVVVVYSNIGIGLLPLLLGSKRSETVWIHNIRSGPVTGGAVGWIGRKMLRIESGAFDSVVFGSVGTRRMIYGQDKEDGLIVMGVANLSRFQYSPDPELRHSLGIPETACMLVYAGTLHPTRKTETLLLAARHLMQDSNCPDFRLVIIGEGADAARQRALAAEYGVGERVLFLGRVLFDKMPSYYSVADIGVGYVTNSPEYGPQPPLKTVEMLGCGLPVVATDTEGNRTFVTDGVNGLLVEDTPEAVAAGMKTLICSPQLRAEFSSRARASVAAFDFERLATDVMIPEYHRLVQQKRSAHARQV